jgi:polysaccharide pyruvyl transferase WcaK-like protein
MRIAILGPFGDFNLGEEATFVATLYNLVKRFPQAQIACGAFSYAEARRRYHLETFPIQPAGKSRPPRRAPRPGAGSAPDAKAAPAGPSSEARGTRWRALWRAAHLPFAAAARALVSCGEEIVFNLKCFRRLRGVDLVVVAGGNQCFDFFGGPWHYPFLLLRWTVLARLRGARVVFLSVGAGPIRARLSRIFLRAALSLADSLSFRDAFSRDEVVGLGIAKHRCAVLPDLAFGLPAPGPEAPRDRRRKPAVAINPMPVFDDRYWPDKEEERYRRYVEKLAAFADWLVDRGYPVFFVATQPRDEGVVGDIGARMARSAAVRLDGNYPGSVEKLLERLSEADIVVATRYHGIVLAYVMERPVLGIAYWHKTTDLMEALGQTSYLANPTHLLGDQGDFTLEDLVARFQRLESRLDDEKRRLHADAVRLREDLDRAFDGLLNGGPGIHGGSTPPLDRGSGAPEAAPFRTLG